MQRFLPIIFCIAISAGVFAQNVDFGGIVGAEASKKLSHFELSAGAEGRFNNNFTNFNRLKIKALFSRNDSRQGFPPIIF